MVDRDYKPFGSVRDSMDAMAKLDQARTNEALRNMAAGQSGQNANVCPICKGTGRIRLKCGSCDGTGKDKYGHYDAKAPGQKSFVCLVCKGTGFRDTTCSSCNGTGKRR